MGTGKLCFERSTITVRVTRQSDGAPMACMDVNFSISKNESNGSFVVIPDRTDTSGIATAIYQAGELDGIDTIQAGLDNGQFASVTLTVY
jgi:hypothetical protein